MLVLLAGVTGNVAGHLLESLASRGHQIRGLGRNPGKLTDEQRAKLESFVTIRNYYDTEALDKACTGVDAVICAYTGNPIMQLDAQLILLRAVERAGVTRFLPATWGSDWRKLTLGMQPAYDAIIAFHQQVKVSSTIKPIYMMTGALAETFFSVPGHGFFTPAYNGPWDGEAKSVDIWGTGNEKWDLTSERDAAEFSVEVLQRDDAHEGGYWEVHSGAWSIRELVKIYKDVRGVDMALNPRGSIDDLRKLAYTLREERPYNQFYTYIGLFFQLFTLDGTVGLKKIDNDKLNVKTTSIEQFLRQNPTI